jgi:LysM repeat protein
MRVRSAVLLVATIGLPVSLVLPAAASADCVHVVSPGESLTSIAAADGLTIDQLAAANGLSPMASLLAGSCLTIPPQSGPVTSAPTTSSGTSGGGDGDNDSDDVGSSSTAVSTAAPTTSSGGSYVVQPGDTLSGIAARAGMTVSQLAAANGIDPLAPLWVGTVLKLSGGSAGGSLPQSSQSSQSSAATSQPVGAAAEGSPVNPPYPTPERLSAGEIGSIAAYEGVPPSLAEAIAWQESGFNNDLVSSADARGIMQILPGTWNWIGQSLATPPPLGQASAAQNVRAGTLLLHSLLQATGGNQQLAAAGYFQGLPSVERNGMYPATQQYVNDVMSLEHQFGGG